MEYLDDYITTVKHVVSKIGFIWIICWQGVYYGNVFSRQVDLAYDSIPPLELSLWSPIKFIQKIL